MSTTHSYRRATFATPPPIAGSFILSKSGKSTLLVEKSTVFRRSGEAVSRDTIRLQVTKVALPADAIVLPWPIAAKVVPTPPVPAAVAFHAAVAHATAASTGPKSRKQIKRDFARQAKEHMENIESVVPASQRNAVMDGNGHVVRGPTCTPGNWRDPEDDSNVRSRVPRMVRGGYRRCDPLVTLAKSHSSITIEHVLAGDAYRLQWEKATGGGSGGRSMAFTDRQFSASMGPSEIACESAMKWDWTQRQLSVSARLCLDSVVLQRVSVSTWAAANGKDRRYAIGTLCAVLDQLLVIFCDDIAATMAQERVSLD
jgi:hypothetical protein